MVKDLRTAGVAKREGVLERSVCSDESAASWRRTEVLWREERMKERREEADCAAGERARRERVSV